MKQRLPLSRLIAALILCAGVVAAAAQLILRERFISISSLSGGTLAATADLCQAPANENGNVMFIGCGGFF